MSSRQIVLASQSPRRKQLLEWAEIPFDIIVQATDESYPAELPISEIPIHIARQKAKAVAGSDTYKRYETNATIIAADTIVVLDNLIIGKPADKENAVKILQQLSGKQHQVITGVVIVNGSREVAFSDSTNVWFHELKFEQIVFYVDKYQPYDKAGAYAIQEWIGVTGIKKIEGDFYNVMGLPVSRVVHELNKF